jgi:hypothetical protein
VPCATWPSWFSTPDDPCPARRSRRGARRGGRVRTREAATADSQSLPATFPQPPLRRSGGRWRVYVAHIRPSRLVRAAIVLKPSTLLRLHRALTTRKYRPLFSSTVRRKPGPKGPSREVIAAVVDMKQRNPTWGCPRIAQQITLAFGIPMNKDVVRRILVVRYRPKPDAAGLSWLGASICFGANRLSFAPTGCSW